jgi:hypothetical protein
MWHDKNWIANTIGTYDAESISGILTSPDLAWPTGATIDYNAEGGSIRKYSVLANVEIEGGELVGKDVYWNTPTGNDAYATPRMLPNKFDPWTYAYDIRVPTGTSSIVFRPMPLSTRITLMKVNGADTEWGASVTVSAGAGNRITVDIVAPDGTTSSSYTFTVALV